MAVFSSDRNDCCHEASLLKFGPSIADRPEIERRLSMEEETCDLLLQALPFVQSHEDLEHCCTGRINSEHAFGLEISTVVVEE